MSPRSRLPRSTTSAAVTLPNARVTLDFPKGLSVVAAPNCGKVTAATRNVVCGFGDVRAAVSPGPTSARGSRASSRRTRRSGSPSRFASATGRSQPILTGASAKVLASTDAANRGSCRKVPASLTAVLDAADHLPALALDGGGKPQASVHAARRRRQPGPAGWDYKTKLANVDVPRALEAHDRQALLPERDASGRELDLERRAGREAEPRQPESALAAGREDGQSASSSRNAFPARRSRRAGTPA